MKFESKIAAFLDTPLLFAWDPGTKQLIGCKWVIGTVDYNYNTFVTHNICDAIGVGKDEFIYTISLIVVQLIKIDYWSAIQSNCTPMNQCSP